MNHRFQPSADADRDDVERRRRWRRWCRDESFRTRRRRCDAPRPTCSRDRRLTIRQCGRDAIDGRRTRRNGAPTRWPKAWRFCWCCRSCSGLIGFARQVLVCRWLEPRQLGEWDIALKFLMLAAPLSVLGLPGSFGRYMEHYRCRGHLKTLLRRTAAACIVLSCVSMIAIAGFRTAVSELIYGTPDHTGMVLLLAREPVGGDRLQLSDRDAHRAADGARGERRAIGQHRAVRGAERRTGVRLAMRCRGDRRGLCSFGGAADRAGVVLVPPHLAANSRAGRTAFARRTVGQAGAVRDVGLGRESALQPRRRRRSLHDHPLCSRPPIRWRWWAIITVRKSCRC